MRDAAAWRAWASQADESLLERFNGQTYEIMCEIRKRYPGILHPESSGYAELKAECSRAMLELAQSVDPDWEWDDDAIH